MYYIVTINILDHVLNIRLQYTLVKLMIGELVGLIPEVSTSNFLITMFMVGRWELCWSYENRDC